MMKLSPETRKHLARIESERATVETMAERKEWEIVTGKKKVQCADGSTIEVETTISLAAAIRKRKPRRKSKWHTWNQLDSIKPGITAAKAGTAERIAALANFYANNPEQSAFTITDDEISDMIATSCENWRLRILTASPDFNTNTIDTQNGQYHGSYSE